MFGWAMARRAHPNLVLTTCILASSLAFVDGSVSYVGLRQLWQLPCSVTFTTGGPTLVPSWMKGYN